MGSAWRLWTEDLVALGLSPNLHHHFEAYSATPPCEAYASRFGQVMGEISLGPVYSFTISHVVLTISLDGFFWHSESYVSIVTSAVHPHLVAGSLTVVLDCHDFISKEFRRFCSRMGYERLFF